MTERIAWTVPEFAKAYGFSVSIVYNMIRRGQLTCLKMPNSFVRIRKTDIEAWEANCAWAGQDETEQNSSSSRSQGGGNGTSAFQSREVGEVRSRARAQRIVKKLRHS